MSAPRVKTPGAGGRSGAGTYDEQLQRTADRTAIPLERQQRPAPSARRRILVLFAAAGLVGVETTRDRILRLEVDDDA